MSDRDQKSSQARASDEPWTTYPPAASDRPAPERSGSGKASDQPWFRAQPQRPTSTPPRSSRRAKPSR